MLMRASVTPILPLADIEGLSFKLPRNVEAEAALLGALMIANNLIDPVADRVQADDFFEPLHARIFSAIVAQYSQGNSVNPITLSPLLAGDAAFEELGSGGYLAQLTGSGVAVIGAVGFAEQIADLAQRRRIIGSLFNAMELAKDTSSPLKAVIEEMDTALATSTSGSQTIKPVTFQSAFDDALATIDDEVMGKVEAGMRLAGLEDWNAVAGALKPGEITILGGRPGMGKTAASLAVALAAARAGHGTSFVSLEMRTGELMRRAISDLVFSSGDAVEYDHILNGKINRFERERIAQARMAIESWPLMLTDPTSLKIGQLAMLIRRQQRRMKVNKGQELKIVIIDYLQLIRPNHASNSLYQDITEISRTLKEVAKECGVALIVLAQLNREVEKREDKRPKLSDLRDSGSIEQDADNVIFLFREEYYLQQSEPLDDKGRADWEISMSAAKNRLELIAGKRRSARVTSRKLYFFSANQAVRNSNFYQEGGE
jgi:replicative DNA helicase